MSIYQSPFQHVLKGLADAPSDAFALDADEMWMHWALEEARKGVGHTAPNPPVGCIVVQGDRLVAKGYHHSAGRPHAEAEALSSATENLEGATAYVTLEPCNHHGRTPPCTERLIQAKVKRVVVGTIDPNPQVNGAGMERLRQAGIDVKIMSGPFGERASELIAPFRSKVLNARPWVALKSAVSFDGGIAAGKDQQTRITTAQSHAMVHRLRSCVDAVLVGENTVKIDDPALTVRETMGW